jgi:hypothetical protein
MGCTKAASSKLSTPRTKLNWDNVRDSLGVLSLGFGGVSLNTVHSVLETRETRKGLYPSSTRLIVYRSKEIIKGR